MSSFYSYTDYKKALRDRLQEQRQHNKALTLRRISELLPVQYTYLSKAMNDDKTHLSEDHIFNFAKALQLLPDEIDYLILLRSIATATSRERKAYLRAKISAFQNEKVISADHIKANQNAIQNEISYLFNPLCMAIHVSLFIKEIKNEPRKLLSLLGITEKQLNECLDILERNAYIEMGSEKYQIKTVQQKFPHYGPDHPLMRLHQLSAKSMLLNRLSTAGEDRKDSFFVTFTAEPETIDKVKIKFREFLNEVQKITLNCKPKSAYQLSFDFLKLF